MDALAIIGISFGLVVVAAIAIIAFGVSGFNKLRRLDVRAAEAMSGIDVQLTRRADLIPNLVETVKGYASHERSVFDEVTSARSGVATAAERGDVQQKAAANAQLDRALVNMLAVSENYPELKADARFASLQAELSATEDKLSFARQYYNDAVSQLNQTVTTLPYNFLAGPAGVTQREFYEAPEGNVAPPSVSF